MRKLLLLSAPVTEKLFCFIAFFCSIFQCVYVLHYPHQSVCFWSVRVARTSMAEASQRLYGCRHSKSQFDGIPICSRLTGTVHSREHELGGTVFSNNSLERVWHMNLFFFLNRLMPEWSIKLYWGSFGPKKKCCAISVRVEYTAHYINVYVPRFSAWELKHWISDYRSTQATKNVQKLQHVLTPPGALVNWYLLWFLSLVCELNAMHAVI